MSQRAVRGPVEAPDARLRLQAALFRVAEAAATGGPVTDGGFAADVHARFAEMSPHELDETRVQIARAYLRELDRLLARGFLTRVGGEEPA